MSHSVNVIYGMWIALPEWLMWRTKGIQILLQGLSWNAGSQIHLWLLTRLMLMWDACPSGLRDVLGLFYWLLHTYIFLNNNTKISTVSSLVVLSIAIGCTWLSPKIIIETYASVMLCVKHWFWSQKTRIPVSLLTRVSGCGQITSLLWVSLFLNRYS